MPLTRERAEVELWWRNPQYYLKQCVEVGTFNFVWDSGYLAKRRLNHRELVSHWSGGHYWRSLEIDAYDAELYDHTGKIATWPVWSAEHQNFNELTDLTEFSEVVVIKDLPSGYGNSDADAGFRQDLQQIQEDYPECKLFIHGSYSAKMIFGSGFKLADHEPRTHAAQGKVYLHGARRLDYKDVPAFWVNLFGLRQRDLKVPAERCKFNIEMLLWNATYWNSLKRFAVKRGNRIDYSAVDAYIAENQLIYTSRMAARPGDRVSCDDCSLWLHCKYFREGAVCAVPKSDMSAIAEMFGTRDSSKIMDGLGKLLKVQVQRAESGIEAEQRSENPGKVDPALNKLMKDIETGATSLLMLSDPQYRTTGKVQINVGTGAQQPQLVSPDQAGREVTARAVAYLEEQGFKREEMTIDMIKNVVAQMLSTPIAQAPTQAIEQ